MEAVMNDYKDLLVVEVLDLHGRVVQRERLPVSATNSRFTLGRSPVADVMLDDVHVAALHAAIDVMPDGELRVTDLGTVNGMLINGVRQRGLELFPLSTRTLQLGQTHIRLRLGSDALSAEQADHDLHLSAVFFTPKRSLHLALVGGLICTFFMVYFPWLGAPRDLAMPVTISLLSAIFVVGAWTAVWSLLTRVMQGEWRWLPHAAVFLGVMAVLYLLDSLLEIVWFAFDLPGAPAREMLLMVIAGMVAMCGHLLIAAPMRFYTAQRVAVFTTLLIAAPSIWMIERGHSKDVNYIGANTPVYPAALHLKKPEALDAFFAEARLLKDKVDRQRQEVRDQDGEDDAGED